MKALCLLLLLTGCGTADLLGTRVVKGQQALYREIARKEAKEIGRHLEVRMKSIDFRISSIESHLNDLSQYIRDFTATFRDFSKEHSKYVREDHDKLLRAVSRIEKLEVKIKSI